MIDTRDEIETETLGPETEAETLIFPETSKGDVCFRG